MTMKLTAESQDLVKMLTSVAEMCNICDSMLEDGQAKREEQQKVYDLKRSAVEFSHQLLQFMGVEGEEKQKEKPSKEVLLRANR